MLKNMKWLSLLLIIPFFLLTGCGKEKSSLPYEKGEIFKEHSVFVEILADDEWKVNGYGDNVNEYALYKVESTEYKSGEYTVIALSLKQSFGSSNSFFGTSEPKYYILASTENGFSMSKNLDSAEREGESWEEFKEGYGQAKDKEEFLKERSEKIWHEFIKTN